MKPGIAFSFNFEDLYADICSYFLVKQNEVTKRPTTPVVYETDLQYCTSVELIVRSLTVVTKYSSVIKKLLTYFFGSGLS